MFTQIPDIASFLLTETGSIWGTWQGRMTYDYQRKVFGRVFGKGLIIIDGLNETVTHRVKVAFGWDYEDTTSHWRTL